LDSLHTGNSLSDHELVVEFGKHGDALSKRNDGIVRSVRCLVLCVSGLDDLVAELSVSF
jgi:hypothetical protein